MSKEPETKEELPPQISQIDRLVARQKKPWVLNEDYAVITEDTRDLGKCSGCDTNNYCSHIDRSRRKYCGGCIDKLSGKTKVVENRTIRTPTNPPVNTTTEEITKAVESVMATNPISDQIDLTVIMGGRVYDLVARNEACDHSQQKFVDSMAKRKSNFCAECGRIMKYRKSKNLDEIKEIAKEIKKRKEKKDGKTTTNEQ